jgi:hypothetical protein
MQPVGLSARWEIGPRYLGCLVPMASPGPPNWTCGGSGRSGHGKRCARAPTGSIRLKQAFGIEPANSCKPCSKPSLDEVLDRPRDMPSWPTPLSTTRKNRDESIRGAG